MYALIRIFRTLYICHVTRDDLIVGFLGEYQRRRNKKDNPFEAALIVCGRKGKYQLSAEVEDMLNGPSVDAPVMIVGYATHDAMSMIHKFTPKLNIDDTNRVMVATEVQSMLLLEDALGSLRFCWGSHSCASLAVVSCGWVC
jgi:hypothetical protein